MTEEFSQDKFQFELTAEVFKSNDAEPGKERRIGGWASTESLDRQQEIVVQKGLDFSEFLQYGWFNDNHDRSVSGVVGYPEKAEFVEGKGWWVEGYILKGYPRADAIWELAKSLNKSHRKLGFSIEGKVLQRKGNKITKAKVENVAITHRPVNPQCTLEVLAKSFCEEDNSDVEKAMEAGYGTDSKELCDGSAVRKQSLEGKLKKLKEEEEEEENEQKQIQENKERRKGQMTEKAFTEEQLQQIQELIEKAMKEAKEVSQSSEMLQNSENVEKAMDVSGFVEDLVDSVTIGLDSVAKSVHEQIEINKKLVDVVKSLSDTIVELSDKLNTVESKVDEISREPISVKKSVTEYVDRKFSGSEASGQFTPLEIRTKLEELVLKGQLSPIEIARYESTGILKPEVKSMLMKGGN